MIYEIHLVDLPSFKDSIKIKPFEDFIDTNIGTKIESGFDVLGNVSISLEELLKEFKNALERMVEGCLSDIKFDFIYFYEYGFQIFKVKQDYKIKDDRVYFELEV